MRYRNCLRYRSCENIHHLCVDFKYLPHEYPQLTKSLASSSHRRMLYSSCKEEYKMQRNDLLGSVFKTRQDTWNCVFRISLPRSKVPLKEIRSGCQLPNYFSNRQTVIRYIARIAFHRTHFVRICFALSLR